MQYKFFNKSLSKIAINNFLTLSYVPSPLSIFEGTSKLKPGTFLEIDLNQKSIVCKNRRWYSISGKKRNEIDQMDYALATQNLDKILNDAVEKQLISDVEVGSFLSGGIDSSIISSIASRKINESKRLKTFSVSFNEADLDESKYARELADHIKSDHYEISFSDFNIEKLIQDLPLIYDEPFADSSQLPTVALSRFASERVKVCLSGDGGDEIFAGYNRHIYGRKLENLANQYPKSLKLANAFLSKLNQEKLSGFLASLSKIFNFNRSSFLDEKINKLIYLLPKMSNKSWSEAYESILKFDSKSFISEPQLFLNKDTYANFEKEEFSNFLIFADFNNYLPDDIFTKVDRASMNFSLEVRAPLLDEGLVDFASSLPIDYKIHSVSKRIFRDVGSKYVPKNFFNRPKQGFSLSIEGLLRDQLNSTLEECKNYLLKNCTHLIDQEIIDRAMIFKNNKLISPKFTWNLIVFSLWHEYYISR